MHLIIFKLVAGLGRNGYFAWQPAGLALKDGEKAKTNIHTPKIL
jgi:hypothetical protein